MLQEEFRQNVGGFMHPQGFKSFLDVRPQNFGLLFICSAEMNENILRIVLLLSVFSRFCQQPVDWKHIVNVSLQCLGNFVFINYFILYGFLVKQVFIISLL